MHKDLKYTPTSACAHILHKKLSVVYYIMPSCHYRIVVFVLHILISTPISGTSAIYMHVHTKLFCSNVWWSSLDACMTQLMQPSFRWASTTGTLMSSLYSEVLQHLCSKRAVAVWFLLPFRLAAKWFTRSRSQLQILVTFRSQNATWLPRRRRCSLFLSI